MAGAPEELLNEIEELKDESDPFDRHVAMSMAIVAALLACVTMLSHRAHTETLSLPGTGESSENRSEHLPYRSVRPVGVLPSQEHPQQRRSVFPCAFVSYRDAARFQRGAAEFRTQHSMERGIKALS
jgi:hypothetical protein